MGRERIERERRYFLGFVYSVCVRVYAYVHVCTHARQGMYFGGHSRLQESVLPNCVGHRD